jgi:hypothetical protein
VQEAEFRSSFRMSVAGSREIGGFADPASTSGFRCSVDNGEAGAVMAMPVSPAANSWRGFQELNTRLKDDFWSVWLDAVCPRALSRVGQTLRTNIRSRRDQGPPLLPPIAKPRIGAGNHSVRIRCQTGWALHRSSGSADLAGVRIAGTYLASPSADGEPAKGFGRHHKRELPVPLDRPVLSA